MLLLVYHHLGDSWESAREGLTSRLLCFTTGFPGAPKGSPLQLFSLCSNLCIGAVSIFTCERKKQPATMLGKPTDPVVNGRMAYAEKARNMTDSNEAVV